MGESLTEREIRTIHCPYVTKLLFSLMVRSGDARER
jgi:hypothetical protein